MARIASIGSLLVDLSIDTPRTPLINEILTARRLVIGAGGKGANAAAAVARLGAECLMVGKVGKDEFGRLSLETLRANGVDTSAVGLSEQDQTGVSVIMINDQHENATLVIMGANDAVDPDYVTQTLTAQIGKLDAILIDFEIPEATVKAAVEFGKRQHIPVVIDAGPARPFNPETWRHAMVLSPNEHEAAAMVGYKLDSDAAAVRAARELLAHGPQAVVIKRSSAGALLVTADDTELVPIFPVEARDPTAAGDAFTAMLTLSLVEKRPLREAVRRANAAGALTVTRLGTLSSLPTRVEVEDFLAARK